MEEWMMQKKLSRRKFLQASAIGVAGLALAACAPAGQPVVTTSGGQAGAGAPAAETVTIRFMSRAGADNNPNAQEVLDTDFRELYPDIQVSLEPAPDGWVEKLLAQMVAGTAVDIFEAWGNIFFQWSERDLLLDCQPYVDSDLTAEQIADYNDFQWEGLVMRGVRVGMPKYINVMTVTVNKDLFEKYNVDLPPADGDWDHDDYALMAQQLTKAAADAGDANRIGGWYPAWNWDRFWYRIDMFGGSVADQKYGRKCTLDSPESQAALQWMYDRMWSDNSFAQPAQVENKWGSNALAPGFVCFMEDGTYPIGTDRALGEEFNWDMYHVPKGPTGIRKVLGTTDAWSITKQTSHSNEAWKVLSFLSGPVYQDKQVVAQEGLIPVLKSRISNFIETVRAVRPSLEEVRLETIPELLEWGYAEDSFWFDNQNAAAEIIRPALEKVFIVGDVGPEYFIEVAEQVTASQLS
jgi:ABC-type glycerol-3-phosphate transport system substrate-binding protein